MMHRFYNGVATAVGMGAVTVAQPSLAATIFDTGRPDETAGYFAGYFDAGSYQSESARFTVTQATRITGIQGFLSPSSSGTDLTLSVHAVSASGPGAVIASQIVKIPTGFGPSDWCGGFSDGALLLAPGDYWASFVADPDNANRYSGSMAAYAPIAIPVGAYRNNFTGANWIERELYFGFRVFGDAVGGAVPEPASWAMMIAGFTLVGGAVRRRRSLNRIGRRLGGDGEAGDSAGFGVAGMVHVH